MSLLSNIINGLSLGSIYALIALGYTMVYGIAKMLNFAHGDIIMIGAYIAFVVMQSINSALSPLFAVIGAMIVCTVLGILIEFLAYRPLRQAASLAVLITAIGVSYFLQNLAQLIWTANTRIFTSVFSFADSIHLAGGELIITWESIATVILTIIIMLFLTWFTGRTRLGRSMRAVAEDKKAAELMGINVNFTIFLTFAIGSALAAIAGVLLCSSYPNLQPTIGAMPGIKAFTAAVLGGIGSIPGAMLGGVMLGLIETLSKAYLPAIGIPSELSDAVVFSVLIIILLVKPTGLLGKQRREKV